MSTSKKSIPSSKSLVSLDTKKMINLKCKEDHFGYKKRLTIKKNYSCYTKANIDLRGSQVISNVESENYRKSIAPASLDNALVKRALHQSNVHYSQSKDTKLPTIHVGSSYSRSFHVKSLQNLVKGKANDGFFLKLPWPQNPTSQYKKNYETPEINECSSLEKGRPQDDHIKIFRTPFKGSSNYDENFAKSMTRSATLHLDSSDCIKSKDHLKGVNFQLKGQSEYKSSFETNNQKQNVSEQKQSSPQKKEAIFPNIDAVKRFKKQNPQLIPKKSITLKKIQSSSSKKGLHKSDARNKIPSNLFW